MIIYLASFVNTDGAAFPDTEAVNVTAPGAGDGTEFVALMVNDIWGRAQALMDHAGLVPDGVTEAPGTAQILEAIGLGFGVGPGVGVTYWKNDTPAVHGDRILLLQGQTLLIATYSLLDAAVWVGAGANPTAPSFFRTSDAGGTIRNVAGPYLVLPDCRGLSLKNIGDATISARTKTGPVDLGEVQEDQGQEHYHEPLTGNSFYVEVAGVNLDPVGALDRALDGTTGGSVTDGVHGAPRVDDNFRDSTLGTNFGITY